MSNRFGAEERQRVRSPAGGGGATRWKEGTTRPGQHLPLLSQVASSGTALMGQEQPHHATFHHKERILVALATDYLLQQESTRHARTTGYIIS